jgi:hypothetical protein
MENRRGNKEGQGVSRETCFKKGPTVRFHCKTKKGFNCEVEVLRICLSFINPVATPEAVLCLPLHF